MKTIHINKLTIASLIPFLFILYILLKYKSGVNDTLEEWQITLSYAALSMALAVCLGVIAYFPIFITTGEERLVVWYLYLKRKIIYFDDIKEIKYPVTKTQVNRPYIVFEIHLKNGQVFTIEDGYINMRERLLDIKYMVKKQSEHNTNLQ